MDDESFNPLRVLSFLGFVVSMVGAVMVTMFPGALSALFTDPPPPAEPIALPPVARRYEDTSKQQRPDQPDDQLAAKQANDPYEDARRAAERAAEEAETDRLRRERIEGERANEQLAYHKRQVSITMYSTSWCGVCKRARRYMDANAIAYTDHDIDADPAARDRAAQLNPQLSVPTITIDEELMIGFGPDSLEAHIESAARRRAGS